MDYPSSLERDLTLAMDRVGLNYTTDAQHSSPWIGVLREVLPLLLLFGMLAFLFRQIGGRMGGGFRKSNPKLANSENNQLQLDQRYLSMAGPHFPTFPACHWLYARGI